MTDTNTTDHPETHNPLCPDHSSHVENAADRLFPHLSGRMLTADQMELADAEAETEYLACEGHGELSWMDAADDVDPIAADRTITAAVRPLLANTRPDAWRTAPTRALENLLDRLDGDPLELLSDELENRYAQDAADRGAMNGTAPR